MVRPEESTLAPPPRYWWELWKLTGTHGGIDDYGIYRGGQRFLPKVSCSSPYPQVKDISVRRLPAGLERETARGDGGAASREDVEGGEKRKRKEEKRRQRQAQQEMLQREVEDDYNSTVNAHHQPLHVQHQRCMFR